MKRLLIYVDASVVGGCEDSEFSEGSLQLWRCFSDGSYRMALSELTLNELKARLTQYESASPRLTRRMWSCFHIRRKQMSFPANTCGEALWGQAPERTRSMWPWQRWLRRTYS